MAIKAPSPPGTSWRRPLQGRQTRRAVPVDPDRVDWGDFFDNSPAKLAGLFVTPEMLAADAAEERRAMRRFLKRRK